MEGERKWKNEAEKIETVIGVQRRSAFQNPDHRQKIITPATDHYSTRVDFLYHYESFIYSENNPVS